MYQSGRSRETRQKRVSLPPKAGELASLDYVSISLADNILKLLFIPGNVLSVS